MQYSRVKHRKERSAKKTHDPACVNNGVESSSKRKLKKEMSADSGNALAEGRPASKLETVVAKKRKSTAGLTAPQPFSGKKKSRLV